tara:strand:+ start:141 stop:434 length:294 start_codon:yes stop_codon:yes gene_type:complete
MNSEPIKELILNRLKRDESLIEIGRYISVQAGGYTQEEADDAYNAVHDICNDIAHEIIEYLDGDYLEKGFLRVLKLKDRRISELEKLVTTNELEVRK